MNNFAFFYVAFNILENKSQLLRARVRVLQPCSAVPDFPRAREHSISMDGLKGAFKKNKQGIFGEPNASQRASRLGDVAAAAAMRSTSTSTTSTSACSSGFSSDSSAAGKKDFEAYAKAQLAQYDKVGLKFDGFVGADGQFFFPEG